MTRSQLYQLVDQLPEETLEATAELLQRIARRDIDPDQAWFWTRGWQDGEREAEADLASGHWQRFEGDDAFLAHLESIPPAPAT